jgi:hypothetical protein
MLVEAECYNPGCPGREWLDDETPIGHKFLASKVPPTMTDPGFVEGTCDLCGEENFEYEYLTKDDIEERKYNL